ncbi:hypothetical protein RhiirA5_441619 [Rhizophagus irregularis]|uniref:DUF8211 domain-containing protein n=1 Tax=Rhizophagus irregularis TaxID=588596 RepID=A0A2N0NFG7_9GLOM|nr:hypothetical protein RhiirA5_441619 [Rhizophagus irregularis]
MIEAKGLPIPPRRCEVPCPIVMSNKRYGCDLHFFKKYPAAVVFARNEHESKSIFSSRTGLSYNSRYIVCNSNRKLRPGRTHIYHKLMNNFRITPSPNPRTARNQKIRYERSCHRILSQEVIKPGAISSTSTKLITTKKG